MHLYLNYWYIPALILTTNWWCSLIPAGRTVNILEEVQENIYIFVQGGPIDHWTHVLGTVAKHSAESEYDSARNAGIDLAHFVKLNNEFTKIIIVVVPEQALLIILGRKSAIYMANNGKDTKHTREISRRMNFVRNGDECNLHKTVWCEGGLQLE